jgi:hypothetical protein
MMARTDRTRTENDSIETSLARHQRVQRVQELRRSNAATPFADSRRPKGGRQGVKVSARRAVLA